MKLAIFCPWVRNFTCCWYDFCFKEIHTFIQKECIKLIKSDSKDIDNVTEDLDFK